MAVPGRSGSPPTDTRGPPLWASGSRRQTQDGALALRTYYAAALAVGGVYLPFFPRWLEARGMFGVRLGVIAAAAPAMGVIAPTAFGALADALKLRGGLLQIACAGALLTFGVLTAASAAGLHLGFGVLFLCALVFALFRSPMGFVADLVALELAPAAGTTYGRLRLWGSLGFLVAVLVAARTVDPRDPVVFPAVTTGVIFAALLASLRLPRRADLPDRGDRHGALRLLVEADFRLFLAAVFLGQCAHAAYDLCFTIHLFDLGVPRMTIGWMWALGTACEVLMMACSGPLFRAFAPLSLFAFAIGAGSFRWALLAVVRSPAVLLLLQPLHALSFALAWLAAVSYTSRRFPRHSLGTAQGLFSTAMGAGSVVGMVVWGSVYQRAGGAAVFGAAACLSACAAAFAAALDRRVRLRIEGPVTEE
ncbi:MAG TPA: MFS transporter [Polyangiaceae bacterium]|nr:MFS transporter [Polyangiaceae bacterium]